MAGCRLGILHPLEEYRLGLFEVDGGLILPWWEVLTCSADLVEGYEERIFKIEIEELAEEEERLMQSNSSGSCSENVIVRGVIVQLYFVAILGLRTKNLVNEPGTQAIHPWVLDGETAGVEYLKGKIDGAYEDLERIFSGWRENREGSDGMGRGLFEGWEVGCGRQEGIGRLGL